MGNRSFKFDNWKALLIILMVFGHFLEISSPLFQENPIYKFIYLFHMPCFIFINGYFSKFSFKKVAYLSIVYLLFQFIFYFFRIFVLKEKIETIFIIFAMPYWILWYIFTLIIYTFITPLLKTKSHLKMIIIITLSIIISLSSGFIPNGYVLSISRTLSFLPFFVIGYYFKNMNLEKFFNKLNVNIVNYIITGILISIFIIFQDNYTSQILYGSYSYTAMNYGLIEKSYIILTAFSFILLFNNIFSKINFKIKGISQIGKYTLPIYILHAFIVKLVSNIDINPYFNIFISLYFSIFICFIFGNNFFNYLFVIINPFRKSKLNK